MRIRTLWRLLLPRFPNIHFMIREDREKERKGEKKLQVTDVSGDPTWAYCMSYQVFLLHIWRTNK